jgi:hypothetical protein
VGVAVVRSAVGLQPLRDATADELAGPLHDVIDALLGPWPIRFDTRPMEETCEDCRASG